MRILFLADIFVTDRLILFIIDVILYCLVSLLCAPTDIIGANKVHKQAIEKVMFSLTASTC